jgi:hypothetical protein
MAFAERKLRKQEQMSDAVSDYYDCSACLWPGVLVEKVTKSRHSGSLMPTFARIILNLSNRFARRDTSGPSK